MPGTRPTHMNRIVDAITPEDEILAPGKEPLHHESIMNVADEAVRTGLSPLGRPDQEIPGEDDVLRAGDPDADPLQNEYSGEESPGMSNASPDANNVDEIGELYGVPEPDIGELVLGDDLIDSRDRDRWENDPRSRD